MLELRLGTGRFLRALRLKEHNCDQCRGNTVYRSRREARLGLAVASRRRSPSTNNEHTIYNAWIHCFRIRNPPPPPPPTILVEFYGQPRFFFCFIDDKKKKEKRNKLYLADCDYLALWIAWTLGAATQRRQFSTCGTLQLQICQEQKKWKKERKVQRRREEERDGKQRHAC